MSSELVSLGRAKWLGVALPSALLAESSVAGRHLERVTLYPFSIILSPEVAETTLIPAYTLKPKVAHGLPLPKIETLQPPERGTAPL